MFWEIVFIIVFAIIASGNIYAGVSDMIEHKNFNGFFGIFTGVIAAMASTLMFVDVVLFQSTKRKEPVEKVVTIDAQTMQVDTLYKDGAVDGYKIKYLK